MEKACEPMKKRKSLVPSGRVEKVSGTIFHILKKERKGPQANDGWILFGEAESIILKDARLKYSNWSMLKLYRLQLE